LLNGTIETTEQVRIDGDADATEDAHEELQIEKW
jgi:hypothetical protein